MQVHILVIEVPDSRQYIENIKQTKEIAIDGMKLVAIHGDGEGYAVDTDVFYNSQLIKSIEGEHFLIFASDNSVSLGDAFKMLRRCINDDGVLISMSTFNIEKNKKVVYFKPYPKN